MICGIIVPRVKTRVHINLEGLFGMVIGSKVKTRDYAILGQLLGIGYWIEGKNWSLCKFGRVIGSKVKTGDNVNLKGLLDWK